MRNLLSFVLAWIAILGVSASAAAQPDAVRPTIHRVTINNESGVLTISGAGLGPHLIVTIEETSVPLLPGATDSQVEVAPPPALLTTPGTYRLTVMDPVRQIGDAFVVASQPGTIDPVATLTGTPNAASSAAAVPAGSVAVSPAVATVTQHAAGPAPMTIEDSGIPYRTATGFGALFSNTILGTYNTASGYTALYSNTLGTDNTATGAGALFSNTTGISNTATGRDALVSNTTGASNTAIGRGALYSNSTGGDNTATGASALATNSTGYANTASGKNALVLNSTGYFNTASGASALSANTTGHLNTASGYQALYSNTAGSDNVANGSLALYSNTTGDSNTATGDLALYSNTDGFSNTAIGFGTLHSNTTGLQNTASGISALSSNTTGYNNTASGAAALYFNTTGFYNTALGVAAGSDATTGSFNVFLGARVSGTASDTHTIRLGVPYDGTIGQNRTFIAGIYGTQLSGSPQVVYIDASGQLGTAAIGGGGGGFLPMVQLQQHERDQDRKLRDQQTVIDELRARLARLEAAAAKAKSGK